MRVTIVALGSRGAVQPYVALATGLRSVGHHVRIAAYADFEPLVRHHDIDFHPITRNADELETCGKSDNWLGSNPVQGLRRLSNLLAPVVERSLANCNDACHDADVVVYSTIGWLVAQHVIERRGVPGVAALLQPATPTEAFPAIALPQVRMGRAWNRASYRVLERLFWLMLRRSLDRARDEVLNLPPMDRRIPFASTNPAHLVLYGYSPSIVPKPADWNENVHVTGYWFVRESEPWTPTPELRQFLSNGAPPVYIGFGSMRSSGTERLSTIVAQTLRTTGERAIVLSGWGLNANGMPDSVLAVRSVPHDWLFPQVSAVVHHAGGGTTAAGLRAGVPAVTVPFFADQPFWGARIHLVGAGPRPIPRTRLRARSLSRALRAALGNHEMHERAQALGERIRREDGVGRAVEAFEGWVKRT